MGAQPRNCIARRGNCGAWRGNAGAQPRIRRARSRNCKAQWVFGHPSPSYGKKGQMLADMVKMSWARGRGALRISSFIEDLALKGAPTPGTQGVR